jgi:hypothetical protein
MRYLLLFALALAFECCYTLWSLSVSRNRILTASLANCLIPFLQLLSVVFLVEATTWGERLAVCGATGLGYAAGTALVMLVFRRREAA